LTDADQIRTAPAVLRRRRPRKGKLWALAVTVVALVVAGGLTYFIYLAPNDTESPEDVFRAYVDALCEGDVRTALDYTLGRFLGEEYLDARLSPSQPSLPWKGRRR
jgi:hypothetical protein